MVYTRIKKGVLQSMYVGEVFMMMILIVLSKEDIQNFYLENRTLLMLILLAIGEGIIRIYQETWNYPLETFLYEMMLLLLMNLSRKKLGGGDLIVLAALGLIMPIFELWAVLLGTFTLLLPSALLLWIQEKDAGASLPFLPFLTGGILMMKILYRVN